MARSERTIKLLYDVDELKFRAFAFSGSGGKLLFEVDASKDYRKACIEVGRNLAFYVDKAAIESYTLSRLPEDAQFAFCVVSAAPLDEYVKSHIILGMDEAVKVLQVKGC